MGIPAYRAYSDQNIEDPCAPGLCRTLCPPIGIYGHHQLQATGNGPRIGKGDEDSNTLLDIERLSRWILEAGSQPDTTIIISN